MSNNLHVHITPDDYYSLVEIAAKYLKLGIEISYLSFLARQNGKGTAKRDVLDIYRHNLHFSIENEIDAIIKKTVLATNKQGKKEFLIEDEFLKIMEYVLEEEDILSEWEEDYG